MKNEQLELPGTEMSIGTDFESGWLYTSSGVDLTAYRRNKENTVFQIKMERGFRPVSGILVRTATLDEWMTVSRKDWDFHSIRKTKPE